MSQTNAERMQKALGFLGQGLTPYCEDTWKGFYGDDYDKDVS